MFDKKSRMESFAEESDMSLFENEPFDKKINEQQHNDGILGDEFDVVRSIN